MTLKFREALRALEDADMTADDASMLVETNHQLRTDIVDEAVSPTKGDDQASRAPRVVDEMINNVEAKNDNQGE